MAGWLEALHFNPHLPSVPVHPYQLDESISNFRGVWCTFHFYSISTLSIFLLANSEDPDQTLHSDMGLHCLPMSQKHGRLCLHG